MLSDVQRALSFTCGYLSSATKVCSTVTGDIEAETLDTHVVYKFVFWKIKTQIRSCMVSHYSQVQIKISSDVQLSVTTLNRGICVILNSNTVHNKIHEKSCEQYFFNICLSFCHEEDSKNIVKTITVLFKLYISADTSLASSSTRDLICT